MLDKLNEIPLLKSLGISSIIAVIGGLIPLLGRMGIVTSVTSSKVEKLLFSKEKRFYIGFIQFMFLYVLSILFTSSITVLLSEAEFSMKWVGGVTWGALLTLVIFMIIVIIPEKILFKLGKLAWIISFIDYILHILCLFFITPFLIVATLYDSLLTKTEIQSIFTEPLKNQDTVLFFLLLLSVANLLSLLLSYLTTRQFFNKFNVEKYYIVDDSDSDSDEDEIWFIYHPVDQEHILLGNEAMLESATEFKLEEISKMLNRKINRYTKSKPSKNQNQEGEIQKDEIQNKEDKKTIST